MKTTDWIELTAFLILATIPSAAFGIWQQSGYAASFMFGTLLWIGWTR